MNYKWKVTEEMKAETKVWMNIYLKDFVFLIIYTYLTYMLRVLVHSDLRIVYYIFSAAMALFLTLPSTWNKKRRNYQSLLIFLQRNKKTQKPIVLRREESKK